MKVHMSMNVARDLAPSFSFDFGFVEEALEAMYQGAKQGVTESISLDGEDESLSTARAPESDPRSSAVNKFGPLNITTKTEGSDKFSLIWHNRMNNASIALHKFSKGSYVVELRVAGGAPDLVNFKAIEHAVAFALLNTDVKGVQDDHALKARRFFYQYICGREPRAKDAITFTKTAWQVSKLRGEEVKFSEGTLEHIGRLMFLLPKERAIIYTYENGKPVRHTVPFNEIWM